MIYRIDYSSGNGRAQDEKCYICEECLRERESRGGMLKVFYSSQWQGETCQFCREVGE